MDSFDYIGDTRMTKLTGTFRNNHVWNFTLYQYRNRTTTSVVYFNIDNFPESNNKLSRSAAK